MIKSGWKCMNFKERLYTVFAIGFMLFIVGYVGHQLGPFVGIINGFISGSLISAWFEVFSLRK
jgi:hypothetical protein